MPDATSLLEGQESVLEDVKVVIEYARAEKFFDAAPSQGERCAFNLVEAEERFKKMKNLLGVAGSLFAMNLSQWAVRGQSVPKHAARTYGRKYILPKLSARSQDATLLLKEAVGIAVVGMGTSTA